MQPMRVTFEVSRRERSRESDKPFFAHLYVDDKFVAKKQVGVLGAAGTVESETVISFPAKPLNGVHRLKVEADMTSPVHIELDKENNYSQADTPDFQVKYPKVSIDSITREPEETTFAEGTALTFSVKLTNNSSFAISDSFDVDLSVGTNAVDRKSVV